MEIRNNVSNDAWRRKICRCVLKWKNGIESVDEKKSSDNILDKDDIKTKETKIEEKHTRIWSWKRR